MIWGEIIQLFKWQRRLLLSCSILFVFYNLNSKPAIFNPNLDIAGSFEYINPASQTFHYDYYRAGVFYRYNMLSTMTVFSQINKNYKSISFGLTALSNRNIILSTTSFFIASAIRSNGVSFGASPGVKILNYADGVSLYTFSFLLGTDINLDRFYSSVLFAFGGDNEYKYYFSSGIRENQYNFYVQIGYEDKLFMTTGMTFAFDERIFAGCSFDSEKRTLCSVSAKKNSVMIDYTAMLHPDFPASHGLICTYMDGNRYYKLNQVKTIKASPDYKLTARTDIPQETPIDINHASIDEIDAIKSIGRATAIRIYTERVLRGDYQNYDRIDKLQGIGKITMEILKENTYIGGDTDKENDNDKK